MAHILIGSDTYAGPLRQRYFKIVKKKKKVPVYLVYQLHDSEGNSGRFSSKDTFVKIMHFFFKQRFLSHEDKQSHTKISYTGILQYKSRSSNHNL